jgi:hypothetical protein
MVLLVEVGHRKAVRRPEVERDCRLEELAQGMPEELDQGMPEELDQGRLEELDQCTLEDMVDTEEM